MVNNYDCHLTCLVVGTAHKSLVSHDKVKLLQCMLGQNPPEPWVAVRVHERVGVLHARSLEKVAGVPGGCKWLRWVTLSHGPPALPLLAALAIAPSPFPHAHLRLLVSYMVMNSVSG